jgi:cell pole-organizing protein PopZ
MNDPRVASETSWKDILRSASDSTQGAEASGEENGGAQAGDRADIHKDAGRQSLRPLGLGSEANAKFWARPANADAFKPDTLPLVSSETEASVGSAFSILTQTILSQNVRHFENVLNNLLRAHLQEWLNAQLPDIVERLVKTEIQRVTRSR